VTHYGNQNQKGPIGPNGDIDESGLAFEKDAYGYIITRDNAAALSKYYEKVILNEKPLPNVLE